MTIREQLADALRVALDDPTIRVIDHARTVDAITSPLVMLERTTVAKAANAMGAYLVTFTVHVVGPKVGQSAQDADLDSVLDFVLQALDAIPWLHWDSAVRSVFLDSWPSFQINVQTITEKTKGV